MKQPFNYKRAFMSLKYGPTKLSLMWDVKEMFDPVDHEFRC